MLCERIFQLISVSRLVANHVSGFSFEMLFLSVICSFFKKKKKKSMRHLKKRKKTPPMTKPWTEGTEVSACTNSSYVCTWFSFLWQLRFRTRLQESITEHTSSKTSPALYVFLLFPPFFLYWMIRLILFCYTNTFHAYFLILFNILVSHPKQ